jgi:hypothetical protein
LCETGGAAVSPSNLDPAGLARGQDGDLVALALPLLGNGFDVHTNAAE